MNQEYAFATYDEAAERFAIASRFFFPELDLDNFSPTGCNALSNIVTMENELAELFVRTRVAIVPEDMNANQPATEYDATFWIPAPGDSYDSMRYLKLTPFYHHKNTCQCHPLQPEPGPFHQ